MSLERRWTLDEAALLALGGALGASLAPGDVVALTGPLGAGKSVLSRAAVYGAGVDPSVRVASPTFTVVQEYAGRIPVHHADLYRLSHDDELDEVGLLDRGEEAALLIEWAERFSHRMPADALFIELAIVDGDRRALLAKGAGPKAERLIAAMDRRVTQPR